MATQIGQSQIISGKEETIANTLKSIAGTELTRNPDAEERVETITAEERHLFYANPIHRAKKYELF